MPHSQLPHNNATGAVIMTNAQGNIKRYLTDDPTATIFRFSAQRFTPFGSAIYFEDFDSNSNAYLGNTCKHTFNRNCDVAGAKFIRTERPGIGNYQTFETAASSGSYVYAEIVHKDLVRRYNDVASGDGLAESGGAVPEENDSAPGFCTATDAAGGFKKIRSGQPFYTDGFGFAEIDWCQFHTGGQHNDRHDGDYMYLWHEINSSEGCVPRELVGSANSRENNDLELKKASMKASVTYTPLCFTFCRAPSMAMPLISTMYNSASLEVKFRNFSELICNYSGAGNNANGSVSSVTTPTGLTAPGVLVSATTLQTAKRLHEDTMTNSKNRGIALVTAEDNGFTTAASAAGVLTSANNNMALANTDFPVSLVSLVYFLAPGERAAFASSSFYQIVEATQKLTMTTGKTAELAFRTDQLMNAVTQIYVAPKWPEQMAANEHFTYGGANDHVCGGTFEAITDLKFTTNGSVQFQKSHESFYRKVQPFLHHNRMPSKGRRTLSMSWGAKANGRGPVQIIGYINLSRTTNSELRIGLAKNMWERSTQDDATTSHASAASLAVRGAMQLLIKVYGNNGQVQKYLGGVTGFVYTQANSSA